MTGRPAALSALAFASTARVADSAIPPIRAEILGCSAERVTSRGEELVGGEETLPAWACMLMGPSSHARDGQVGRVARSGGSSASENRQVRRPVTAAGHRRGSSELAPVAYTGRSGVCWSLPALRVGRGHIPVLREGFPRSQPDPAAAKGRSSTGRAAVSKTAGCRFKSCRPCSTKNGRRHRGPSRARGSAKRNQQPTASTDQSSEDEERVSNDLDGVPDDGREPVDGAATGEAAGSSPAADASTGQQSAADGHDKPRTAPPGSVGGGDDAVSATDSVADGGEAVGSD